MAIKLKNRPSFVGWSNIPVSTSKDVIWCGGTASGQEKLVKDARDAEYQDDLMNWDQTGDFVKTHVVAETSVAPTGTPAPYPTTAPYGDSDASEAHTFFIYLNN